MTGDSARCIQHVTSYLNHVKNSERYRKGKIGQLIVDDMEPVVGKSEGILELLNSDGNYFIGWIYLLANQTGLF